MKTRYEVRWFRVIYLLTAFVVVLLGISVYISQANKTTERHVFASDNYIETMDENQPIQVASKSGRLYTKDGKATHHILEKGDVFLKSDEDKNIVAHVTDNRPKDNVEQRHMLPLQAYGIGGETLDLYILNEIKHFTSNDAGVKGNGYYSNYHFTNQSYRTLTEFIYDELEFFECDFEERCEEGHFSYEEGTFKTTLLHGVDVYDGDGEVIGELDAGTTIGSTFELEFASGASDKSLMRIIGFTDEDGEAVNGTFFIDMFTDGNELTFATSIDE